MEKRRRNLRRARASTQDVLGTAPAKPRVDPKWRNHHDALVKSRNRLMERKGVLARDASEELPAFSLHMADAATDTYDRDFALSIATSEQSALYEIDAALNRIREGTYGVCELTGKPIEKERLKAIPWARFSASAEKELERAGAIKRPKLGQLIDVMGAAQSQSEDDSDEE